VTSQLLCISITLNKRNIVIHFFHRILYNVCTKLSSVL
jgi:hypothetical protein